MGFDFDELLLDCVQRLGQTSQRFALSRNLGRLHRAALDRVVSGLLSDAVRLRGGVLLIELQQARGDDVGLLFGIDDVQLALKLCQGSARALHLCVQLLKLLLHELRKPGGREISNGIAVLQVGLRNAIGDVGSQALVRRLIADQQDIGVRRAGNFELFQHHGRIFRLSVTDLTLLPIVILKLAQVVFAGHRAEDRVGLDQLDLCGQELIGVVGGRLHGFLAKDAGGHSAVDIDDSGGLVNRSQPQGDDQRGDDTCAHEGENLPAMPFNDPKIMRQRNCGLFRLRIPACGVTVRNCVIGSAKSVGN